MVSYKCVCAVAVRNYFSMLRFAFAGRAAQGGLGGTFSLKGVGNG